MRAGRHDFFFTSKPCLQYNKRPSCTLSFPNRLVTGLNIVYTLPCNVFLMMVLHISLHKHLLLLSGFYNGGLYETCVLFVLFLYIILLCVDKRGVAGGVQICCITSIFNMSNIYLYYN